MCEGMIFFVDCPCISNPTGTNKPNFSCLLCKNCWKNIICFFSDMFLCLTLEFSFVVFTIIFILTRFFLDRMFEYIFYGKYCYLYYLGDS